MTPPVAASPARAVGPDPTTDTLAAALTRALAGGGSALPELAGREPVDRRDRFLTLLTIYDLHSAPLETLGDAVRAARPPSDTSTRARTLSTSSRTGSRAVVVRTSTPRSRIHAARSAGASPSTRTRRR